MKALKIIGIMFLALILACAVFLGVVFIASLINDLPFYSQWKAWFGPLPEPIAQTVKTILGK